MLKKLKRLTCRHSYIWSERRQLEVCCHCGQARAAPDIGLTPPTDPDRARDSGF